MSDYTALIQRLKDHTEPIEDLQSALNDLPRDIPAEILSELVNLMLTDPYITDDPNTDPYFEEVHTIYPIRNIVAYALKDKFTDAVSASNWFCALTNESAIVSDNAFYAIKSVLSELDPLTITNPDQLTAICVANLDNTIHAFTAIGLLGVIHKLDFLKKLCDTPIAFWDTGNWQNNQWGNISAQKPISPETLHQAFVQLVAWAKESSQHALAPHIPRIVSALIYFAADEKLRQHAATYLAETNVAGLFDILNDTPISSEARLAIIYALIEKQDHFESLLRYVTRHPNAREDIQAISTGLRAIHQREGVAKLVSLLSVADIRNCITSLFPLTYFDKTETTHILLEHICDPAYQEIEDDAVVYIIKHGEIDFSLELFKWLKTLMPTPQTTDDAQTPQNTNQHAIHTLYRIAKKSLTESELVGGLVLAQSDKTIQFPPPTLEGMLDELGLRATIRRYFMREYQKHMDTLWDKSNETWAQSIGSAKANYIMLLTMSITIFVIGVFLLLLPMLLLMSNQDGKLQLYLGSGMSFLAGLGLVVTLFYSGPFKNINNIVNRLNRTHVAFVGFMMRMSQISIIFEQEYTYNKLDSTSLSNLTLLIDDATEDIAKTLLVNEERKSSEQLADLIEAQYTELVKQQLGLIDPSETV